MIKNDVERSLLENALDQQALFRVLNAYASSKPTIGYCQGMNLVAGLLLRVSSCEEEAFRVFVQMMNHLGLAEFFQEGMQLLQRYVQTCSKLFEEAEPEFCAYMQEKDVTLDMLFQKWFLSLFIECLPLH